MAHASDEAQTTSLAYDGSSITSRLRKQTVATEFLVRNPCGTRGENGCALVRHT
jgi:hypothetical protein